MIFRLERYGIDIPKCIKFTEKTNQEKLQAIINGEVDGIFGYSSDSIKTYCRMGQKEGYSDELIMEFISQIRTFPLTLMEYKGEKEIVSRNLH